MNKKARLLQHRNYKKIKRLPFLKKLNSLDLLGRNCSDEAQ
jgi:hypothetical protein